MQFNHELIPQPEQTVPFETPKVDANKRFMQMQDPEFIKEEVKRLKEDGYVEFTLKDARNKFKNDTDTLKYMEDVIAQGYTFLVHPLSYTKPTVYYKIVE